MLYALQMSATYVSQWKQKGRTCLWRYKPKLKLYDSWHFTADAEGCDSLVELLELMSQAEYSQHRTLTLTDPQPVGADQIFGPHEMKVWHPEKLRLSFDPTMSTAPGLVEVDGRIEFALSPAEIQDLREAIADVRKGDADFGVGFGDKQENSMHIVRFWWWPRKA